MARDIRHLIQLQTGCGSPCKDTYTLPRLRPQSSQETLEEGQQTESQEGSHALYEVSGTGDSDMGEWDCDRLWEGQLSSDSDIQWQSRGRLV